VFPEQNLLLNVTAYYYTYKNLQALVLKPATAGTNGIPEYVTSTSDQHARGLEVELQWAPTDGLRLGLNGAFINSTYTRYIAPDGNNLAGQPTGTPIFSGAASLSYTLPHVFNGSLVYDASYGYRGKSRCNSDSQLQGNCQVSPNFTVGSARQSVDMRLDWNAPGSRWGVGVFVTNLLNKRYVTGVDNTAAPFGLAVAHITPPRMWGVELRAKL
jgi:iron complex outermembrane receptor protein